MRPCCCASPWPLCSMRTHGSRSKCSRRQAPQSTSNRLACPGFSPISRSQPRSAAERSRSEEHTSELQSLAYLVCRLLLEKKKKNKIKQPSHKLCLIAII